MQIHNSEDLERAIIEMERRKVIQQDILVQQFRKTTDSLNPINLVKGTLSKMVQPGDTRSMLIKLAGGVAMGFLTKGLFVGKSHSKLGSIVGSALKLGTTKAVVNNADKIKAYGVAIYNNLFKKRHKAIA
jgi:hypothetical protein